MKTVIAIATLLTLGSAGCSPQNNVEVTPNPPPGDSLTLIIDAEPGIPIGYGQTWQCDVREVVEGELTDLRITLSTIGNASAELYNGYFGSIDSYTALEIAFERLDERPGALSGFKAADGTIWQITTVKSAKDRLPWAIEGNYIVSGPDPSHKALGDLKLSNGKYVYTPLPCDITPSALGFPMLYGAETKGEYTIEFFGEIKHGVHLDDLPDNEILLTINFDPEGKHPDFEEKRKKFLIRNDRTSRELYFHSIVSEFEVWRVRKGWDE